LQTRICILLISENDNKANNSKIDGDFFLSVMARKSDDIFGFYFSFIRDAFCF